MSPKTCWTLLNVHNNPPGPRIKEKKTRYSAKPVPDERRLTKFNQAADLDECSASESTDENYDRYPPSDHSATHGEERLSDNEIQRQTKSSFQSEDEHERKCREVAKPIHEKHVEMCSTAMKVMGRLNKFLDKYEDSDDTD